MPNERPKAFFSDGCFYDAATEILHVEFTVYRKRLAPLTPSGRPYIYEYEEVPLAISEAFLNDDEDGTFYNAYIRAEYEFNRLQ